MALVKAEEMGASFKGMSSLNALRQIGLLIGLAASIAIGATVFWWAATPNYGVLYGSLAEEDVSSVLDALRQNNIDAKLDQTTGAILVPASEIHNARIKMAAMGLPKGVSAGFDQLDEKNNFGLSQFMETARYQHALEIELARTIMSLSSVKNARVHLAIPRQSVFVRDRQKASASVVVDLFPGRLLEDGQVAAIAHMVSSSVPNLETEQVTVVDSRGNLLTNGHSDKQLALNSAQFDYTRRMEKSYIDRINGILEPLLGQDALRAQVTADIDFTLNEQTQELYNPDAPALRSNQLTEEVTNGGGNEGGVPGALSNQPPGAATAPETAGANQNAGTTTEPSHSRKREIRNFELDKTISHTRYAMGNVRRLSVAVVVDDKVTTDANGKTSRLPRTPEELDRMTELVKKAVGFNAQRGDSVNVINSSFTVPAEPAPLPEIPLWEQPWLQDLVKKVIGAALVLLLVFGVLRPVMKSLAKPVMVTKQLANEGQEGEGEMAEDVLSLGGPNAPALGSPKAYDQKLATATKVVESDPKLVAQVVKNWVAADG
jgi:flagellar M-ring protein FliF